MGLFDVLGELAGAFLNTESCSNCKFSTIKKEWNGSGFSNKWGCIVNKHAPCSSTYLCKHYQNRNR